jgi:hypothetical protein
MLQRSSPPCPVTGPLGAIARDGLLVLVALVQLGHPFVRWVEEDAPGIFLHQLLGARTSASEYRFDLLSLLHMRVKLLENRGHQHLLGFLSNALMDTEDVGGDMAGRRVPCCDLSERGLP